MEVRLESSPNTSLRIQRRQSQNKTYLSSILFSHTASLNSYNMLEKEGTHFQ